jgi:hypothetical protein
VSAANLRALRTDLETLREIERERDTLAEVLLRLRNEVRGMSAAFEWELREVISNTNFSVLLHRLDEADTILRAAGKLP